MRTVRSNFFVGIRTPWTLSNDVVWRKTHELGGKIWFYTGIILAIVVFFLPQTAATVVMFSGIFFMVIIPVVYSYLEYRKINRSSEIKEGRCIKYLHDAFCFSTHIAVVYTIFFPFSKTTLPSQAQICLHLVNLQSLLIADNNILLFQRY